MSGQEINRSMWLMLLPLMLLFAIVFLILILTTVDFTQLAPGMDTPAIAGGIYTMLPWIVPGIVIGMLIMIYSMARRRR